VYALNTDTSQNNPPLTNTPKTILVPAVLDATPPLVAITNPVNGATISGTQSISANASDNTAVASVQFQLDGTNLATLVTTAPYTISWDSTSASNGGHSLSATARDVAGNTASTSVTIQVSNAVTSVTVPPFPTTRLGFVTDLYRCILGRSPDSGGLTGWVAVPASTTLATFYSSFFNSPEYLAKATTDQTYVDQLYACVLFRLPDTAGRMTHLGELAKGTVRNVILSTFLGSAEFTTADAPQLNSAIGFKTASSRSTSPNLANLASVLYALEALLRSLIDQ
jgi:hypothetical protein